MATLFSKRAKREVGHGELSAVPPMEPDAPAPGSTVEREPPAMDVYLNPDASGGRKRIILMLSEDGTIIEPLLRIGGLSVAAQAALMVQQTSQLCEQMIGYAVGAEQENITLKEEIAFLREQIEKGVQPPRAPYPPPLMPTEIGE